MIHRMYRTLFLLMLNILIGCNKEPVQVERIEGGSIEVRIAYRVPRWHEIPDYKYVPETDGRIYLWNDTAQCLTCGKGYIHGTRPEYDGYHTENNDYVKPTFTWHSDEKGIIVFSNIPPGFYLLFVESGTREMYSMRIIEIISGETLRLCKYFSNAAHFSRYENEEPWEYISECDTIPHSCN